MGAMRFAGAVSMLMAAAVLAGCGGEKVDSLAVVHSATISDIRDNTGTDMYAVSSAYLAQTGLGLTLTLGFDILRANGVKFDPVSTVHFTDGTVIVCRADDLRRVPSVQESTDSWDFACDADELPSGADGAYVVIVDDYH